MDSLSCNNMTSHNCVENKSRKLKGATKFTLNVTDADGLEYDPCLTECQTRVTSSGNIGTTREHTVTDTLENRLVMTGKSPAIHYTTHSCKLSSFVIPKLNKGAKPGSSSRFTTPPVRNPQVSLSRLSLDIISVVTTVIASSQLFTTAQTSSNPSNVITTSVPGNGSSFDVNPTQFPAIGFDDDNQTTSSISNIYSNLSSPYYTSEYVTPNLNTGTIPPGGSFENFTGENMIPGEKSTHLTGGGIAGIVLGCLAAIITFGLLMLCFCYKQKKKAQLSPNKKKSGHYTGLFDDGITLSYINCQFEATKDPVDEMISLDNDAYLKSLELNVVNQAWQTNRQSTVNTSL